MLLFDRSSDIEVTEPQEFQGLRVFGVQWDLQQDGLTYLTLDEAMEVLTLLQTGKRYPMPLLLVDVPNGSYWREVLRFFDQQLLALGFIDANDLALLHCVNDVDQAADAIVGFYRNYHSLRYVGDQLHIRLKRAPDAAQLDALGQGFADLLTPDGSIRLATESADSVPLHEEPPGTHPLQGGTRGVRGALHVPRAARPAVPHPLRADQAAAALGERQGRLAHRSPIGWAKLPPPRVF